MSFILYNNQDFLREKNELDSDFRSSFRRDYGRIIHSSSFRRLQGKTQLFPCNESDFFRNRLTHSLEVAQITKSIGQNLNQNTSLLKDNKLSLNEDILEIAGLAHDLGHPPFGHNGEKALDHCMKQYGGFEGNAQTIRILTKLEKKVKDELDQVSLPHGITENGTDLRKGLNLTYRTIASVFKYDNLIQKERSENDSVIKGYYYFDEPFIKSLKKNIIGDDNYKKFKTIECYIMDIADDIAYSTYDLEDSFKVGFLTPFDLVTQNGQFITKLTNEVNKEIDKKNLNYDDSYNKIDNNKCYSILCNEIANFIFDITDDINKITDLKIYAKSFSLIDNSYNYSNDLSKNGYLRTAFTSKLIKKFISGINFVENKKNIKLSKVRFNEETFHIVEILKQFTYLKLIESSRLKISEYRGFDIVIKIFEILSNDDKKGYNLLPEDFKEIYLIYKNNKNEDLKKRVICDFIAGMTDRYILEFYGRLTSENPETIFKPL